MCNALMFTNKIKKNIKNKKNGALCVLFNVFYLFNCIGYKNKLLREGHEK